MHEILNKRHRSLTFLSLQLNMVSVKWASLTSWDRPFCKTTKWDWAFLGSFFSLISSTLQPCRSLTAFEIAQIFHFFLKVFKPVEPEGRKTIASKIDCGHLTFEKPNLDILSSSEWRYFSLIHNRYNATWNMNGFLKRV